MATPVFAGEITRLLGALKRGDADAKSRLLGLVYAELHSRAAHYMRHERPDHTLQATALVNEAYLRLMGGRAPDFQSRAHFFAVASNAMRRVLIDHARKQTAARRPPARQKVELLPSHAVINPSPEELLALDDALTRLAELDA